VAWLLEWRTTAHGAVVRGQQSTTALSQDEGDGGGR
jgi:hypothetical protein